MRLWPRWRDNGGPVENALAFSKQSAFYPAADRHRRAPDDPETGAMARQGQSRGRDHLRHGCRQPRPRRASARFDHPGLDHLDAEIRAGSGRAADPRRLPPLRPEADLLRARLVHRALSRGGRGDGQGRPRGRLPRLHPRGAERAVARRGALLDAPLDRGDREAHRQASARQPLAALQLLDPHRRAAGRGGLSLQLLADGRRRALSAQHAARASWSSCR